MIPMVLVCVHELDTRSRVPFSTSYDQFHAYGTHVNMSIFSATTGDDSRLQSSDQPRSPQRASPCMRRTVPCAARHGRKAPAMERTQRFAQWRTRAHPRWKDHTPRAAPASAGQNTKSLIGFAHAMPQGACECSSDHTSQKRRAEELAKLPQRAKQLQPPFARQPTESRGRTVRSGRQGQPRAGGGF